MLLPMATHTHTYIQGLLIYSKMARDSHFNVTNNYHVMCKHTLLHPQTKISLDFLDSPHFWVETQMCLYFRWEDVSDVPLWFNISAAFAPVVGNTAHYVHLNFVWLRLVYRYIVYTYATYVCMHAHKQSPPHIRKHPDTYIKLNFCCLLTLYYSKHLPEVSHYTLLIKSCILTVEDRPLWCH